MHCRGVILLILLISVLSAGAQNETSGTGDTVANNLPYDKLSGRDLQKHWESFTSEIVAVSRSVLNVEEIPFTAYVISAAEIRERNYNTLVDLMRDLPGIKVSQPGGALSGESFLQRGLFGNYYVKILIDNVPIQPSAVVGMPIGANLPLAQAERVEVIYGPAAAIYGADAMAGVINIITRTNDKKRTIMGRAEVGNFGQLNLNFTAGSKTELFNKPVDLQLYGNLSRRNDWGVYQGYDTLYDLQEYNLDTNNSFVNHPNFRGDENRMFMAPLQHQSGYAGARVRTGKWTFGADVLFRDDHSAIGLNPLFTAYSNPNDKTGETIQRYYISVHEEWKKFRYVGNFSYMKYQMNSQSSYTTFHHPLGISGQYYRYAASDDLFTENLFYYDTDFGLSFLLGGTFAYSGNFPQYNYFEDPFNPSHYRPFSTSLPSQYGVIDTVFGFSPLVFSNVGVLAQAFYQHKNLQAILGVRYDNNSIYGDAYSPRAGVSYSFAENHNVRVNAGTAFRPPSPFYNSQSVLGVSMPGFRGTIPFQNEVLEAETSQSFEVGYRVDWGQRRSFFSLSAFRMRTNNLNSKTVVSFDEPADSIVYFVYGYFNDETAKMQNQGIEARLRFRPVGIFWNPDIDLSFAHFNGIEELAFSRGTLSRIKMQPDYIAKAIITLKPTTKSMLLFRTIYNSAWTGRNVIVPGDLEELFTQKSFWIFDISASYNISESIQLRFDMVNVFNRKYAGIGATGGLGRMFDDLIIEDLYSNPQLPRNFRMGINWQF